MSPDPKVDEPARVGGWSVDLDPSSSCEVIVHRACEAFSTRLIYDPDDAEVMVERLVRVTGMTRGEARQLVVQLGERLWARRRRAG